MGDFVQRKRSICVKPEPHLLAGYDCTVEAESIRDKSGNGYHLTTKNGVPKVGENGGIQVDNDDNSSWSSATPVPVGSTAFTYVDEVEMTVPLTTTRIISYNGNQRPLSVTLTSHTLYCSFNAGATISITSYGILGRGPIRATACYDGTNQYLRIHGRATDSDAVVAAAPAGSHFLGRHCVIQKEKIYDVFKTEKEDRADYVKYFAREIIQYWRPKRANNGPSGGIITNYMTDDWCCPIGASTFSFAWLDEQKQLGLTDTTIGNDHITFPHRSMPSFGSWLFEYRIRDSATDSPYFVIDDNYPMHTYSGGVTRAYYVNSVASGGLWVSTLYKDGVSTGLTVSHPLPAAGDVLKCLLTRHPSGDWRLYSYHNETWYGSASTVANDVTYLSSQGIRLFPRGSYILSFTRYVGELEPQEL